MELFLLQATPYRSWALGVCYVHESSGPAVSRKYCFILVLLSLWILQSFCLLFQDGSRALRRAFCPSSQNDGDRKKWGVALLSVEALHARWKCSGFRFHSTTTGLSLRKIRLRWEFCVFMRVFKLKVKKRNSNFNERQKKRGQRNEGTNHGRDEMRSQSISR